MPKINILLTLLQMYSCYRTALLKPVVESHEYREAFQYLGMLSPTELKSKLEACLECLKSELTKNPLGDGEFKHLVFLLLPEIESDEMDQIFGDTEFHLASLVSFMEGPPPSHTPAAKAEQPNTGEKTPEQTSAANTPVAKKKKMDMAELKNVTCLRP